MFSGVWILCLRMCYSIFYPYRGMDDQIFKNQCILEKMIVWLCWPGLSEKDDIWKKLLVSHPEKGNCENLPLEKYTLKQKPLEKIIIKGSPGILHPYPCMNKKRNTVNPKINAQGVYLIFGIFRGAFIRGRRLFKS